MERHTVCAICAGAAAGLAVFAGANGKTMSVSIPLALVIGVTTSAALSWTFSKHRDVREAMLSQFPPDVRDSIIKIETTLLSIQKNLGEDFKPKHPMLINLAIEARAQSLAAPVSDELKELCDLTVISQA